MAAYPCKCGHDYYSHRSSPLTPERTSCLDCDCRVYSSSISSVLQETDKPAIRQFETGATRDTDTNKLKIEGFIDPLVDKRFSEYMHEHRKQKDGSLRPPDNWQKGIPLDAYADSLVRHVLDFRLIYDGWTNQAIELDMENVLCAIIFNARGYLFELLKKRICLETEQTVKIQGG